MLIPAPIKRFISPCPTLLSAALLIAAAAGTWNAAPAAADTLMAQYYLPTTTTSDGNSLTGRAYFTYLTGSTLGNMQVEIVNDSAPISVQGLISGVGFNITAPDQSWLTATPNGPSTASGQTSAPYIGSFGTNGLSGPTQITSLSPLTTTTGTLEVASSLAFPWTISQTGSGYSLTGDATATGPADRIGPAAQSVNYVNFSNTSSVTTENPILAGPTFFIFTIPGLQSTDTIGNVSFGYGANGNTVAGASPAIPVPEPAQWALLSLGLLASLIPASFAKRRSRSA
jgi:hypothetical protein